MKIFWILGVLSVLVLSAAQADMTADCPQGFEAFQKTVFPKVRRDCALCHDGSVENAPPFAKTDALRGYYALLNRADFMAPDRSVLVRRAGNNHCNKPNCNPASGEEMLSKVRDWWTQGESSCKRDGKFTTAEQPLPMPLPGPGGKDFATVTFDLSEISVQFSGATVSLDVQQFTTPTATQPATLRFRRPQLSTSDMPIHLAGIRVLVNRHASPLATAFRVVDRRMGMLSKSLLSTHTLIVPQDPPADSYMVSLGLDVLEKSPPPACQSLASFRRHVLPTFDAEKCTSCHGGGSGGAGTAPANQIFPMGGLTEPDLCAAARSRVDPADSDLGPFFALPLAGAFGHPKTVSPSGEIFRQWNEWVQEETSRHNRFSTEFSR